MACLPKPLSAFFAFLMILGLCEGCKKSVPKPHDPTDTTFLPDPGILYMLSDAGLQKIEVSKNVTDWTTQVYEGPGTANCPLDYNAGNIYFGGLGSLAAYNYQTGATNWTNFIPDEAGASVSSDYRQTAYQDSLVFYTKPTGVYFGGAQLYCAYRDNGQVIWTNQIDSDQYDVIPGDFNGLPYVVNGNVITLTRGYYGNPQITAYNATTGRLVWNSPQNNELSGQLHVTNNYIYYSSNATACCYSTKDGSLLWQTDLQLPTLSYSSSTSYTFLDSSKLIVCRNYGGTTNLVREINANTGSMMNSFELDVPEAHVFWGYGYNNNVLYTVNVINWASGNNIDSVDVVAFDLGSQLPKWKYNYTDGTGLFMVVTNNNVIVPGGLMDSTSLKAQVLFLDFNGKLVKKVAYAGTTANRFMYVDNSGVLYKEVDY
jgi:outer membrane protein assembly factor BamB